MSTESGCYPRENANMIRWLTDKSPEQRHFVAVHLNWDFSEPTLDWLVIQEDCDLATAVELFWLARDSELLRYPAREDVAKKRYFVWSYDFISTIMRRAETGQYKRHLISYNQNSYFPQVLEQFERLEEECRPQGLPWSAPPEFRGQFKGTDINTAAASEFLSEELEELFGALGVRWRPQSK